jgi:hypothetical protein
MEPAQPAAPPRKKRTAAAAPPPASWSIATARQLLRPKAQGTRPSAAAISPSPAAGEAAVAAVAAVASRPASQGSPGPASSGPPPAMPPPPPRPPARDPTILQALSPDSAAMLRSPAQALVLRARSEDGGAGSERSEGAPHPGPPEAGVRSPDPAHPRFAPPKLYGEPAEMLATWLKMRCVDGVVPGGAPGIVLTGRSGCGKLSTVRWAMRQAGLDVRGMEIFHPWSCESAAGLERQLLHAAMTLSQAVRTKQPAGLGSARPITGGRLERGSPATAPAAAAAPRAPPSPLTAPRALSYRVLVVRHAELWALRASAAASASTGPAPSTRDVNSLAYWSKLTARVVAGGAGGSLPRVAIILQFPDMSLPKVRALVGLKGQRQGEPPEQPEQPPAQPPPSAAAIGVRRAGERSEAGRAGTRKGTPEPASPKPSGATPSAAMALRVTPSEAKGSGRPPVSLSPWKHISLDDGLLRGVGPLSVKIARVMGWTGGLVPFDGDLRALFRRRRDACRRDAPHHLDLNYNIFRASSRLLGDAAMSPGEVRAAVEGDARLVHMVWAHSATHREGIGLADAASDRELWSEQDAGGRLRGNEASGWAVLEWRLTRADPWARVGDVRFERMPFTKQQGPPGAAARRTPPPGAADTARTAVTREFGFSWKGPA